LPERQKKKAIEPATPYVYTRPMLLARSLNSRILTCEVPFVRKQVAEDALLGDAAVGRNSGANYNGDMHGSAMKDERPNPFTPRRRPQWSANLFADWRPVRRDESGPNERMGNKS
jgi:hypothetical protein